MKRKSFTLIEIIISLIIIVISMVSITGLFPLGMRVHNNAMRQNQATDISEEILEFAVWKIRDENIILPTSNLGASNNDKDINSVNWKPDTDFPEYHFYNSTGIENGLIRVFRTHKSYRNDKEIEVTELDVVLSIWTSPSSNTLVINSGGVTKAPLSSTNIVRLNIEASWPGSEDYDKRRKVILVTEVRK